MALTTKFLSSIHGFLRKRNGNELRDWLRVEPPVPQIYHDLAAELKSSFSNDNAVDGPIDKHLPDEDDAGVGDHGPGTAWAGFRSFIKAYLLYWRDVDFDDLLGAQQLLMDLTSACTTALNHPTYGAIMFQPSMSLCTSLSKLSMTLNKRPDLTSKLQARAGDDEQDSVVEQTTKVIQKVFSTCLSDRSSGRNAKPQGKKVGVYLFANVVLKLLFTCRKTQGATQLLTNISAMAPPLSFYPAAQRVSYLYYLGRFHFIHNNYTRASLCLQDAYLQTPASFLKHRQQILTYLIPSNLMLGRLPSQVLLQRPEARDLAQIFAPIAACVKSGDFYAFQQAIKAHQSWLWKRGLLLPLIFRLKALLWRAFTRRTFLITYVPPGGNGADANSNKAATLELEHLLVTATYMQRRLEGWLPAPSSGLGGKQLASASQSTTLVPPPGKPKTLGPDEGMIFGNMAVTAENLEAIVASLVAQGLMHGFVAHSQGRFAVMGAKTKGSAVAAGWPPVLEVAWNTEDSVPGWVRDHDV